MTGQRPTLEPSDSSCAEEVGLGLGLGFDFHRITEIDSGEHGPMLILNVNAVMEHYPTFIFGHLSKRDAGASHSPCSRSCQIR
jgi:hypothetical protein